ncbi:hypothetical protein J4Q44_G00196330 [Coregonus suidteri]|uniref:Uncharacterized protein n=1 Tax=Coregonus suidteri TaxID=861788 RepID=A0AAN8LD30_9TELE
MHVQRVLKPVRRRVTMFTLNVQWLCLNHTCNGTSVMLRCDGGNPVNVNMTWSRNGNKLPGQTNLLLFGMELWQIVLILSGGGGPLLIITIITLVWVYRSRLEEEEEMRLAPLTQPTRQASLHHQQRAQSRPRPQNRAASQATPNFGPQV